jgi:NTP pyrophosphatase (non-canonical NTP hydrolase)
MKNQILKWAEDKGLLNAKNQQMQTIKLMEEVGELANAIIKQKKELQKDAIGDIYIVITILSKQLGLDIDDCIESAYNEIKNRTGKMINGSFIKD